MSRTDSFGTPVRLLMDATYMAHRYRVAREAEHSQKLADAVPILAHELRLALAWLDNAARNADKVNPDDPFWSAMPNNWRGREAIREALERAGVTL